MDAPATKQTPSPHLQRLLDDHRREAARLQEKYGDPEEARSAFVREHFDEDILAEIARESREGRNVWDEDHERDGR